MLTTLAAIIALLATGGVAPGPGQLTRPKYGDGKGPGRVEFASSVMKVASIGRNNENLKLQDFINNPALFDQDLGLTKGSVEACIDDILHSEERLELLVFKQFKDFVIFDNVPSTCLDITKEVMGREEFKDVKAENMAISLVPGNDKAIRVNGFNLNQIEMLQEMSDEALMGYGEDTGLDIHVI
ncbi:hypothetical protein SCUP234_12077 [Seiridium cupressi]